MTPWHDILSDLIRRAACDLPVDVEQRIRAHGATEAPGSRAAAICATILENVALARAGNIPICQDTGTLTFFVTMPGAGRVRPETIMAAAREAVRTATQRGWLRRNTVDPLSGLSLDDNVAPGAPLFNFTFTERADIEITLLLKGGGCENMSRQYSLPDAELKAGRDLEGVRAALLHAVWHAQGLGCAPGILGVCLGADRAAGYHEAKRQLLRKLDDRATEPALATLEEQVLREANTLGIGPMGMSGRATLLAVKIGALTRLPASYFVTVSYMCWACRRHTIVIHGDAAAAAPQAPGMGR